MKSNQTQKIEQESYPGMEYQRLFNAICDLNGCAPVLSEMQDIINIVHKDFPDQKPYEQNTRLKTFEHVANEWIEFAIPTFEKADAISSAYKAKEEIDELIADLTSDQDGINPMSEYADVVLCIIHSLARKGFDIQALINWMDIKMKVNKKREWKLNPNNTYSHIK